MKRSILLIFVLLVLLPGVHAAYDVVAPGQRITMAACTAFSEQLTVRNTGSTATKVMLSADSDWVLLAPESVLIPPGEGRSVDAFIRAPCRSEGLYSITITADDGTAVKELSQELRVTNPDNIVFGVSRSSLSTCPCSGVSVPFTIQNPGNFFERYRLSVDNHDQYYTIVPDAVSLLPGSSAEGFIRFQTPCDVYGDLSARLIVQALNSGQQESLPLAADVAQCYDFLLAAPSIAEACNDDETLVRINITNVANISNSYSLELLDEPMFADLLGDQLSLLPSQRGYTEVLLSPRDAVGNYTMWVQADTEIGELQAQAPIMIDVPVCHGIDITVNQQVDVCEEVLVVPVAISNTGRYEQDINLSITGPEWLVLNDSQMVLDAGETGETSIIIDAHNASAESYEAEITAMYADNSLITDSSVVSIEGYSDRDCYQVRFAPSEIIVRSNITQYAVNMTHEGVKGADYAISLFGPEWLSLMTQNVSLDPAESAAIQLLVDNATNGSYWADVVASTHDVEYTGNIKFQVGPGTPLVWYLLIGIIAFFIILLIVLILLLASKPVKRTEKKEPEKKAKRDQKTKKREQSSWWIWSLILIGLIFLILLVLFLSLGDTDGVNETGNGTANETECGIFCTIGKWLNATAASENITDVTNVTLPSNMTNVTLPINGTEENETCGLFCGIARWWASVFARNGTNATVMNDTNVSDGCGLACQISLWFADVEERENASVVDDTEPGYQQEILRINELLVEALQQERPVNFTHKAIMQDEVLHLDLGPYLADAEYDTFTYFPMRNVSVFQKDGEVTFMPDEDFVGVRYTAFIARNATGDLVRSAVLTLVVYPPSNATEASVPNETCDTFCSISRWWQTLFQENVTVVDASMNETCGTFCTLGRWWDSFFIESDAPEQIIIIDGENVSAEELRNITPRERRVLRINEVLVQAEESGELNTFLYQVWEEDTVHALNLTRYFVDPDKDIISFSYLPVEDVEIVIENGTATFVPAEDFIGVRYTAFIAEDPSGDRVQSPTVTLVVTPAEEPFLVRYGNVFLILGIIVIIVLLGLLYEVSKERE